MIDFRTKIINIADTENLYLIKLLEKNDDGEEIETKSFNNDTIEIINNIDENISHSYKELFDSYNKIMGMKKSLNDILNKKTKYSEDTKDKSKKSDKPENNVPQRSGADLFNLKSD